MKIIIYLDWIIPFLNSPFFAGISTITTGLIALLVYKNQKQEEKIKAARILLLEISDCEKLIDSLKSQGVNLVNTRKIISSDSWMRYKHLFARDLDGSELKLIDDFYQQCNLLNYELEETYNLPNHSREKARIVIEKHASYSENSNTKEEYEKKKRALEFFEQDTYWYQANAPKENMMKRIVSINNITSSMAIKKLKAIANFSF